MSDDLVTGDDLAEALEDALWEYPTMINRQKFEKKRLQGILNRYKEQEAEPPKQPKRMNSEEFNIVLDQFIKTNSIMNTTNKMLGLLVAACSFTLFYLLIKL